MTSREYSANKPTVPYFFKQVSTWKKRECILGVGFFVVIFVNNSPNSSI
jgi:hypothetical protein